MFVTRQVAAATPYPRHLPPPARRPAAPRPRPSLPAPGGRSDPAAQRAALRRWALAVGVWAGVLALGLLYVHRHGQAAQLILRMAEQNAQIRALEQENELLAAQVNQLRSLSRIAAIATRPESEGGLGMIAPAHVRLAVVPAAASAVPPSPSAER